MNSVPFAQPYAPAQQPTYNQIIRRPMTDAERQLPANFYKGIQRGLRGISMLCLILFIFNGYLLPVIVTDAITLDALSIMLTIFMIVMGAVAIGMAVNAIVVRSRVGEAMREGTAIEVIAPAYRTSTMKNVQSWTVGPVSLLPTKGLEGLVQEGVLTSVLCVPKMKAAIAINSCGLRHGARIMFPPNLEAMAIPMGFAVAEPTVGAAASIAPPNEVPALEAQAPPTSPVEESAPVHHAKSRARGHKKSSAKRHSHRSE